MKSKLEIIYLDTGYNDSYREEKIFTYDTPYISAKSILAELDLRISKYQTTFKVRSPGKIEANQLQARDLHGKKGSMYYAVNGNTFTLSFHSESMFYVLMTGELEASDA